jgi:hypothetical protein
MPTIRSALVVTAAVFSIATGAYFAFGDDLTRLIGRQTRMEITPYNDQIAELRARSTAWWRVWVKASQTGRRTLRV